MQALVAQITLTPAPLVTTDPCTRAAPIAVGDVAECAGVRISAEQLAWMREGVEVAQYAPTALERAHALQQIRIDADAQHIALLEDEVKALRKEHRKAKTQAAALGLGVGLVVGAGVVSAAVLAGGGR